MNQKARRAGQKSHKFCDSVPIKEPREASISELMLQANRLNQHGQTARAQGVCNQILAREPAHVNALNLLGLILQASGRHKLAAKTLRSAIAADPLNPACHYNLASSLQALGRQDEAALHFKQAIAFGARLKSTEDLILQNPTIAACVHLIEEKWPLPVKSEELFARHSLQSIADDLFLRCALETVPLLLAPLEKLLTLIRSVLLHQAIAAPAAADDVIVRLFCALARQCFINEYVFAQGDDETAQASRLRELLIDKIGEGAEISPLLLAAVGAYFPLHGLPRASLLMGRDWPTVAADLVRQQIGEPLAEAADRDSIVSLTAIEDRVSLQVMQQYEENPYPRWTVNPIVPIRGQSAVAPDDNRPARDILIAGCGSGQHAIDVAVINPEARIVAIDISLPSLAYARRKTREAGLRNVEYARADILQLGTLARSFDHIEAVGVLHHLAEPERGWRVLLSLLRPRGEMRVGLYSEAGRAGVVDMRAFIAERGYRPTAEDIRKCRQDILRDADQDRWRRATEAADFYTVSGCRDLLFHVMEYRFTIARIKAFLTEQNLVFLGFDINPRVIEQFQKRFPDSAALTDLDKWQAFEADNPQTFRRMYVFGVRKN